VRSPGVQFVRPGTTVAEVIQQAGGWLDQAAPNRVRLRREGREYQGDLTNPDGVFRSLALLSGDEVEIGRRREVFRAYILPILQVSGSVASVINLVRRWN
jgi:protein involved in polysaccharide export with SLBB domain